MNRMQILKKVSLGFLLVSVLGGSLAYARNDVLRLSLEDALTLEQAKEALDPNIKYSFGTGTKKGKFVVRDVVANRKTNAAFKSDEEACNWVLLSSLKALQERAVKEGATKVVNIVSWYNKKEFDSKTQFECGAGAIMAGVVLKGDIVR